MYAGCTPNERCLLAQPHVLISNGRLRAGCLPTLATIPVFWGLYRTLSNASSDGALTGGFYWLPDLAGPTSLAAQKAGATLKGLQIP